MIRISGDLGGLGGPFSPFEFHPRDSLEAPPPRFTNTARTLWRPGEFRCTPVNFDEEQSVSSHQCG